MRIVNYNKPYIVKLVESSKLNDLYNQVLGLVQSIHKRQSNYMRFMIEYLAYAVNRDELKDIYFMYKTKLDELTRGSTIYSPYNDSTPTVILLSPKNGAFASFNSYQDFFKAIDTLEHEISHLYDYTNWPLEYLKFENEKGKYKMSTSPSLISEIFKDTPFEKIALLWRGVMYYNNHLEVFARQRALIATTQFFECLKELYSDQKNWQEIEEGFKKYEERINHVNEKTSEWAHDLFANKDMHDDGIVFSDFKKEFDKVIDATVSGDFSIVPYLDKSKMKLINSRLRDLNELALINTIYNQENIDKLFNMQVNFEKIDYKAISVLIMHKSNQNSAKHLKILREKAKEFSEEDLLQKTLDTYIPRKRKQETPMHLLEL